MSHPSILLIEDEVGLRMTIGDRLTREGYAVTMATDGPSGFEAASSTAWDLILLDLMLPGMSGLAICRALRRRDDRTPIVMLTARDRLVDKVVGFNSGADDYVTKPFELDELVARCEAIMRRAKRAGASWVAAPVDLLGVEVDVRRAIITRGECVFPVAGKELEMLRYLVVNRNEVVSRDELLDQVWGYHREVTSRTVDVHVVALRKKLEPNPRHPTRLVTVHGIGYKLIADG